MCYQTGLRLDKFWALYTGSSAGQDEAARFHAAGRGQVIGLYKRFFYLTLILTLTRMKKG